WDSPRPRDPAVEHLDGTFVDERADHLLDEERVAMRLLLDQLPRRVRNVALAEEVVEQAARRARVERLQLDLDGAIRMAVARRSANAFRRALGAAAEQVQEQDRVVIAGAKPDPE